MSDIFLAKAVKNDGDNEDLPLMQISYLKDLPDAIVAVPYGINARCVSGETLCLVFSLMGYQESLIAIPLATLNRKKGFKDGESALINEKTGEYLYLKDDKTLEIRATTVDWISENITIVADTLNLTAETLNIDSTIINISASTSVNLNTPLLAITSSAGSAVITINGVDIGELHTHSDVETGPDATGGVVP